MPPMIAEFSTAGKDIPQKNWRIFAEIGPLKGDVRKTPLDPSGGLPSDLGTAGDPSSGDVHLRAKIAEPRIALDRFDNAIARNKYFESRQITPMPLCPTMRAAYTFNKLSSKCERPRILSCRSFGLGR